MDRELLITWLNDAYGMEQAEIQMLEQVIEDYGQFPEIQDRLNKHAQDTKHQAEDIETCIEILGGKVSKAKSVLGSMTEAMQQMGARPYDDDLVRNILALHAAEHFEYASYKSFVTAANEQGEKDIADICEEIMEEEKEMAVWTEKQIDVVTKSVLRRVSA